MPAPFRFDRVWTLPVGSARLWELLGHTERYPQWWSWLRRFDADGLEAGSQARCTVQAPLPYALHFTVEVLRVEPGSVVETQVRGDLYGPARLEIVGDEHISDVRLAWTVELRDPLLRRLALVTRPAMVWAHDRIVSVGVDQFRRNALDGA